MSAPVPEPMPTARRVAYGLGCAGFQLTDRIVVVIALYFYLPPPGRGLVPQVNDSIFLGAFTVYGLAMLLGRIFDSLADPLVGHGSDRSRSRLGRRRSFLIYGVGPMVAVPVLLFWPPGEPGSRLNACWLGGLLALYFVAFTVYVAPYLALIPELAWSQQARVRLSRLLALASLPAVVIFGSVWPVGIDLGRAAGLDAATALRLVVVGASAVALLLCLAPILAVDERRFARSVPSDLSLWRAVAATLGNRPFCVYLLAQLLFVFGVNLIQPAMPYFATVVLGRSEGFAFPLGLALLAGTAVGFGAVGALVRRVGPKRAMILCVGTFAVAMCSLGLLEADVPGGPRDRLNLAIVFGVIGVVGIPAAGLLILPHVLISQVIDYDEQRTGANRSAMYFGVQGFLTKWVYGVSLWAITYLLSRYGNSQAEPWGVILIGPVAGGACLVAVVLYALYPEREILRAARG